MLEYKAARSASATRVFLNSISPSICHVIANSKIVNLKYRYVAPAIAEGLAIDGEAVQIDGEDLNA
jgi:hypothetical protein